MTTLYAGCPTLYQAGSGNIVGATSITLTSLTDIYGNVLTMSDFGAIGYFACEPDTSNAEQGTFTGVTANANGTYTLTGVKTILAKSPYTATSGLVRAHAGGTKVVITDNVAFWNTFLNKENSATINNIYTFSTGNTPIIVDAPTAPTQAANKAYIDGIAIAGSPTASTLTLGIVKISVNPVSAVSPIAVGDNDGRVPTQGENDALVGNNTDIAVGSGNKMVTQTGLIHGAEKYAAITSGSGATYVLTLSPVVTSYTTGMEVIAKIDNANTSTTPVINVNSLGNKTIVKGVSTALVAGDLAANQVARFVYDGTNMVLQNPIYPVTSSLVAKTGSTTKDMTTTTTTTIAHGLGVTPKLVTFHVNSSLGDASSVLRSVMSYGSYDGTSQACNYVAGSTNGSTVASLQDSTHAIHYAYGATVTADSDKNVGTVTFDATNITITWSKTNSPTGTGQIVWSAIG